MHFRKLELDLDGHRCKFAVTSEIESQTNETNKILKHKFTDPD